MSKLVKMDKFLERYSFPRLNQEEIKRWTDQSQASWNWNWNCDLKTHNKQKPRTWYLHRQILSNIERKVNTYSSETVPKYCRRRKTSKLILWGHHHPDTKNQTLITHKRQLHANITNEQRGKVFKKILAIWIQ